MFKRAYSTKINAAANFAGSIWPALLGVIFVPFYLNYIGIEAYGLIGVFNSLMAFITLLDLGLSPALNRELARLSVNEAANAQEMRDIKSTLERINWISAVVVGLLFLGASPLVAHYWIQPKDLSIDTVTQAFFIMSITVGIQFTVNFYVGGLMGLQKQLLLGLINVICGTLRSVGAFLVLVFYSPTIKAFLVWQVLSVLLQAVLMMLTLRLSLPESERDGEFKRDLIKKIGRFAAGMTGISVVSLVLTQTDKVILTKMLTLEAFGYYTLAVTISTMAINLVVNSISQAVYPQFSKFVANGDFTGLNHFYHYSCQIASVFLFPIMVVLSLYSREVLLIWTGKPEIVQNTYVLLSLIAIGSGLNGLMWLPYYVELAHGSTRLIFYVNAGAIVLLVPLMIYGIYHYGAIGGALGWVALNASYVLIRAQLMHRRILKGELRKWYFEDLLIPFSGAIAVGLLGKLFIASNPTRIGAFVALGIIAASCFLAAALLTRATRGYLNILKLRFIS